MVPHGTMNGINLPNDFGPVNRTLTEKHVEPLPVRIYNILLQYKHELEVQIVKLQKGIDGETNVVNALSMYKDKYRLLQGIILKADDSKGKTSEVDAYIVTEKE